MTVADAAEMVFALLAVALWGIVLLVSLALTRPARPEAGPAGMELGPEPPAVVNLLANRWTLTEDAAEATMLDLAARRLLELRQPGDDPRQTTVHLTRDLPSGESLRPYERQVLDRIAGLATGGVLPVTALAFRDPAQAGAWTKQLHAAVIVEARRLGLSRRRFGPTLNTVLLAAAAIGGFGLAFGIIGLTSWRGQPNTVMGLAVGFVGFLLLFGISMKVNGERDTEAGRAAAARWLGVREWLRAHEEFASIPPAGVMLWDRYLGYGAALGVTREASMVLDLGMGSRTLIWSAFGGTWHRVKVRYPRLWPHYGKPVDALVRNAAGFVLAGAAVGAGGWFLLDWPLRLIPLVIGPLLLIRGGYVGLRTARDRPAEITGEVLWKQVWRSQSGGEHRPNIPWLHYLTVDDGSTGELVAWGLPSEWQDRCDEGDVVRIRAHPWSRRIASLDIVRRGDRPAPVAVNPGNDTQAYVREMLLAGAPEVFTDQDVDGLLGLPVARETRTGQVVYTPATGGNPMARVLTATGDEAEVLWQRGLGPRAQTVPGVGDDAYLSGPAAYVRRGEFVVALILIGYGLGREPYLPWLLQQAAARG